MLLRAFWFWEHFKAFLSREIFYQLYNEKGTQVRFTRLDFWYKSAPIHSQVHFQNTPTALKVVGDWGCVMPWREGSSLVSHPAQVWVIERLARIGIRDVFGKMGVETMVVWADEHLVSYWYGRGQGLANAGLVLGGILVVMGGFDLLGLVPWWSDWEEWWLRWCSREITSGD